MLRNNKATYAMILDMMLEEQRKEFLDALREVLYKGFYEHPHETGLFCIESDTEDMDEFVESVCRMVETELDQNKAY